MGNGNGKMASLGATCEILEGQVAIDFAVIDSGLGEAADRSLAQAIEWLRGFGGHSQHWSGCQCQQCIPARSIVRAAVRDSTCACGRCPLCWARARIQEGRL